MWKVLYKDPITTKGGARKNQVVVSPENVILASLIVLPLTCEQEAKASGTMSIFLPLSKLAWVPEWEANPLDATSGLINIEKKERNSLRAYNYVCRACDLPEVDSIPLHEHDVATKAAQRRSVSPSATRETQPSGKLEKGDATVMTTSKEDVTAAIEHARKVDIKPIEPILEVDDQRWRTYADDMIALLGRTVDKERRDMLCRRHYTSTSFVTHIHESNRRWPTS